MFRKCFHSILSTLLLTYSVGIGAAQSLFSEDSIQALGLPVVTIVTVGGEEPTCEYVDHPEGMAGYGTRNATKVPGRLTITLGKEVLYDSGPYEKNIGGMRIKIRGNSSAYPRKKPYKLKLEVGADLLLRGDEEKYADRDWLLLKDPELLQSIGFEASRLIGMEWTSGHRYVNLVMNGDYRGLYLLCEPVERNTRCRIDVSKTGYIVESDAYFWCEDLYIPSSLNPFGWTLKYPDADDVTEEQVSFLSRELAQLEESLVGPQYAERIDVESFARWLLAHDILGTWDSYGSNLFIARYDTLDSKVRMPVLWDFDTIFRMEGAWANIHRERFFFHFLLASENDTFRRAYLWLWNEVHQAVFEGMLSYIDSYAASEEASAVDASMRLDAERWNSGYTCLGDHLDKARAWFRSREAWLDERITEEIGALHIEESHYSPIEQTGPAYNAWGMPVSNGYTGIIIEGGKKYIITSQ